MEVIKTSIDGCFELQPEIFKDNRGRLVKTFHNKNFAKNGLETNFTEEYYSVSKKNVLRGLHFQLPPHDYIKCVTCLDGKIFDVVVDLRKNSSTFKQYLCFELDAKKGNMLYIPKGFAHGFYVMSDSAIFLNRTTAMYRADYEAGIRWDTCGVNWPNSDPIISSKDEELFSLKDFQSPF